MFVGVRVRGKKEKATERERERGETTEEEHKLETFGRIPNFSVCCAKANGHGPFYMREREREGGGGGRTSTVQSNNF